MVSNAARSQHTGHPSSSCAKRALDYAPYHECLSVAKDGALQVWGGPLFGGDFAVLLLNRGPLNGTRQPITAYFATLGNATMKVRDVMAQRERGVSTGAVTAVVALHDVAFFRLSRP